VSQENIEFVRRVYEAASRVTLKRDGVMLTQISSSRVSPRIVLYDVVR
jgi:hypothetical protein